jgi:Outer membrane protein beta-barrel domain
MKRLIFAITVVAISTAKVSAQGKSSFGIKAGINSTNQKVSGGGINVSTTANIGFYGGFFAQIGISEYFAVQPELLYTFLSSGITFGGEKTTDNFSYVSVPVLLKYIHEGFSIVVGPQVSFLTSAKEKSGGSSVSFKDEVESTEFAGIIGAGYTLPSGFGFDARYQLGLSNISKDKTDNTKDKINGFSVGLHYIFQKLTAKH